MQQGENVDEKNYNADVENGTHVPNEELLNQISSRDTYEHLTRVLGNHGLLRRDMNTVKE